MKRAIGLSLIFIACVAGFLTAKGVFPCIPLFDHSMEPALQYGSLLTIKPVIPDAIKVGDIIVFNVPVTMQEYYNYPAMVVRRITEIKAAPVPGFRTKGDNSIEDPFTINAADVRGALGQHIPYLGLPLYIFQSPLGIVFIIILLGLLAALFYGREHIGRIFRRVFPPAVRKEKSDNRALINDTAVTEKKMDTEKQSQPEKAATKTVKPFPAAASKPAPSKEIRKPEDLPAEALSAEKALFEALDRLNKSLKKPKDHE